MSFLKFSLQARLSKDTMHLNRSHSLPALHPAAGARAGRREIWDVCGEILTGPCRQYFTSMKREGNGMKDNVYLFSLWLVLQVFLLGTATYSFSEGLEENVFRPGKLKSIDSVLKVKIGDRAPNFNLRAISGQKVSLNQFLEKKNVVLSFVPAAWTPVCSAQWQDFRNRKDAFDRSNALLLGITVDNAATLYAWTKQMGNIWFPVLSDFWPHGAAADLYGILRSDGTSERAIFIIDKEGIIRYIDVHDINKRPLLVTIIMELTKLKK
jgi:peroxiredoxin (alkyl hydroperoxide reductase subunit C)